MLYSNFQNPAPKAPRARSPSVMTVLENAGLDYANPHDLIQSGRSPFAKNFRIYDNTGETRRVQVSTRRGAGIYSQVLDEDLDTTEVSTTGADITHVDPTLNWRAQKYTPTSTGRLTKLEFNMRQGDGYAPVIVELYDSTWNKLADTSILEDLVQPDLTYTPAYFIEAPEVDHTKDYYIVLYTQDDGEGQYDFATTTNSTDALESNSGLAGFEQVDYSINYKSYIVEGMECKGLYRWNTESGINKTIAVYDYGYNDVMYAIDDTDGSWDFVDDIWNSAAREYSFATMDGKLFVVNGIDDLAVYDGATVSTITDSELPILSKITVYKDRLWGVVADEPNKIVFSEVPGNPVGEANQWYNQWLSTSFMYQPAPKVADPIMAIVPFQDNLTVVTTGGKYNITGYDYNTFSSSPNPSQKGSLSPDVVTDGSFLYFCGQDGIYRHNGTSDVPISGNIQPFYDSIRDKSRIRLVYWKNTIRFYFGLSQNDQCLIYDIVRNEWMYDTDTWVQRAVAFNDADDDGQLAEVSSVIPRIMFAETGFSGLGKAIDFEYRTKYESMGAPAAKKRLLKFFPLFEPADRPFKINVDCDKDMADIPSSNFVQLAVVGAKWGDFLWGDGTTWGSNTAFTVRKLRFPGYAHYWQTRISRRAVNNQVKFYGIQYTYKMKRL